jgi:predicted O-linked N-acetylglucosamine transferase (SPINDLY family)
LFDLPELHSRSATVFSKKFFASNKLPPPPEVTKENKRIRIAYFSMDFREHPVSLLLVEIIEHHCREKFEVFGFSIGPPSSDPLAIRIRAAFDKFYEVNLLSDLDVVSMARDLKIDIAIDLAGHTQGARPGLFYQRMAPVQISYLGYPGTTQNPGIDYLVADRYVFTEALEGHFSEKILFLDKQHLPSPSSRPNHPSSTARANYGVPEEAFCFACFNNAWKILPEVFSAWMRILAAVERSVLWLKPGNPIARENLINHAMSAGIDSSRIVFADRTANYSEHLERYKAVDLFLDTFPYGAHTTASDALWMGVPILTLRGRSIPSRVCASLLERLAVRELVAESLSEYTSKAIQLAKDNERLLELKSRIIDNSENSGIFDSAKYTLDIEQAYRSALTDQNSRTRHLADSRR